MPDLSDIENGLLAVLAGALLNQPLATETGAILTTEDGSQTFTEQGDAYLPMALETGPAGIPLRLYRGWPVSTDILTETRAGTAHITLFSAAQMARNTTRWGEQTLVPAVPPPTLLLRSVGGRITVNGTPAAGQACGVLLGPAASAIGYAYQVQAGDDLHAVAAGLAAAIPGASSAGSVITLPPGYAIPRVVQNVPISTEVRRQEQTFRVSCWASNPQMRDVLAKAIDTAMAPYGMAQLTLTSGWSVYVRYRGTEVTDASAQAEIWRRDLLYSVDYPTTIEATAYEMLFGLIATGPGAPVTG